MSATAALAWAEENQRLLTQELMRLRAHLERTPYHAPALQRVPPGLASLTEGFGLSPFEADLLLLCAGVEFDASFAELVASLSRGSAPTFGLALAALPGAHWSALTPGGPLRHWRMIELGSAEQLVNSPLRIDERVLHHLAGLSTPDAQLTPFVDALEISGRRLASSQAEVADAIVAAWVDAPGVPPVVQIVGAATMGKADLAAAVAARMGCAAYRMPGHAIPPGLHERQLLMRLWEREAVLSRGILLLDADELALGDATVAAQLRDFAEGARTAILLAVAERFPLPRRGTTTFEARRPTPPEQREIWRGALGERATALDGVLDGLASHFDLEAAAIETAARQALGGVAGDADDPLVDRAGVLGEAKDLRHEGAGPPERAILLVDDGEGAAPHEIEPLEAAGAIGLSGTPEATAATEGGGGWGSPNAHDARDTRDTRDTRDAFAARLWDACRGQARPRLADLAQPLVPAAGWDDLVLPGPQLQVLHEIALNVRERMTVYERWGFAARSSRGLGIAALFAGPSGTGKTMAAEVLAADLRLDLYRIDLSRVVSKYIGETEKNLSRIFDAAEAGGVILLFDEADALFGKRSEVKDSHDRYANIEVSYLLQRMEAYRGLAILTSNQKSALDDAFLRRLRFVVNFPFPAIAERARIWSRIFPGRTPTRGLDVDKLARLNVAGGNIRNIALGAAFLAAGEGAAVGMDHVLRAARGEYAKLERPLTDAEIRGWT